MKNARAPGGEHRDLIPQPHGGALTPPWAKGESGNPSGLPAGYVTVATAARILTMLPYEAVVAIAGGVFPEDWPWLRCVQYVRVAKALLGPMDADKLTDRMDGPVTAKTIVTSSPIEFRVGDVS